MFKKTYLGRASFGFVDKALGALRGVGSNHLTLANTDPKRFESPFTVKFVSPVERQVTMSKLANGVRVVSETPALPGPVTLGVMLEVGSRNETKENSGALFSIQSTYYKTNLNTNETINYNMVQMSGGKYDMEFDRERATFKAQCLAHDASDLVGMMADCVLEPRSSVSANVAIHKMQHLHKVAAATKPGLKETDLILGEIFGHNGLGMPLNGHEKNIENLNAYTLQKFQIENFSPERIILAGVGVENHGELVALAEQFFSKIRYGTQLHTPEKHAFHEAELKIVDSSSSKNDVFLLFESAPSNSKDFILAALAREYFGYADVTNPNCHAKNNGVFVTDFYSKEKSIYAAEAYSFNFNEVGVFGFRLSTSSDGSNKAIDALAKHLKAADKIGEGEFQQALKRLKRRVIEGTENDYQRINELLCHTSVFGEFRLGQMLSQIDAIQAKDLAAFLKKTVGSKAALVVKGPNVGGVYGLNKVKELLK